MMTTNTSYPEEKMEQKGDVAPDSRQQEGYPTYPAHAACSISPMERQVKQVLRRIGMPMHMKGYPYLKSAILYVMENPNAIYFMTKDIYPSVAKEYGTTAERVERSIRYAIESAWVRGGAGEWNALSGFPEHKIVRYPSNGEFIATVVDYLLEQIVPTE